MVESTGIESLRINCEDFLPGDCEPSKDIKMRLKSLSLSDDVVASLWNSALVLRTLLMGPSPSEPPTLRELDLAEIYMSGLIEQDIRDLEMLHPVLPFITSLSLPSTLISESPNSPLYKLLDLSTSLSNLSLSFNRYHMVSSRHLKEALALVSPSLISLTLRIQGMGEMLKRHNLHTCIPILIEFLVLPTSGLSKVKCFTLEGMGKLTMDDVDGGSDFLEKLRMAGITLRSFC